ncbi:MAG: hypothetical protein ACRDBX_08700 [Erysipelotrichaceae bacterium]
MLAKLYYGVILLAALTNVSILFQFLPYAFFWLGTAAVMLLSIGMLFTNKKQIEVANPKMAQVILMVWGISELLVFLF